MPKRDRTFSDKDVIRIFENHLTAPEQVAVVFELNQRPIREAFGRVVNPEENLRTLDRILDTLELMRSRIRGGR